MTSNEVVSGSAWGSSAVIISQIVLFESFPSTTEVLHAVILAIIGGLVGAITRLLFFYIVKKIKKQWSQKQLNKSRQM